APPPNPPQSGTTTSSNEPPADSLPAGTSQPSTSQAGPPSEAQPRSSGAANQAGLSIREADSDEVVMVGAKAADGSGAGGTDSPYRMRLALSNVGAAIEVATATDHAASLDSKERYQILHKLEREDGQVFRSLALEKINVDGVDLDLRHAKWHVRPVEQYSDSTGTGQRVTFTLEILEDDAAILRLTRTYTLPAQPGNLRHDLYSTITVENLSEFPRGVILTSVGGLGVGRMNPRRDVRSVDAGIHDGTRVNGLRKMRTQLSKHAAISLFEPSVDDPKRRLAWVATANTYFTCTIAPTDPAGTGIGDYIAKATAVDADGDTTTEDDGTVRLITRRSDIAPGETGEYHSNIYLGEKSGEAFRQVPEYSALNYYYQVSQGYGSCTFVFLVELMIWLLNGLNAILHDYGLAIIILVLIVRTLLHPITKKGQVNMVRMQQKMQELQPKIEEIKRKYANDKKRMNEEMMKLNINPAGQLLTCLPMFIQLPVWFALYISLSNNILMRHEPAFYGLFWIDDLTAADALYTFASPIHVPLFGWELPSFNLIPILLAVFMYVQQKLQPKAKPSPALSDQQRQQQEMMQKMGPLMSIMMLLIFYKMPSGLNLYIMTSSLFGIIEQHRIRKHIKEREAAGTLHKKPVDDKGSTPTKKRPGELNFFQKLQKMAEDAKAQQSQRRPKNKVRR
ncbi:MAG: YidC/Oxa1 family insertase periplasmic-domain containing protein, partial [Phycisphaerae bacterium]